MDVSVTEWIPTLEKHTKPTVIVLRSVCKNIMKGAHELISHGALGYSTTESPNDRVCYIAPQAGYVNLGFFFGTHLPDPKNLLQGEGARMRHVKVKAVELARDPAIVQLVKEAWKDGPKSVEELHAKRKRK